MNPTELTPRHVRWENPTNQRYYEAWITQDLLEDWLVVKVWGRQGTARG